MLPSSVMGANFRIWPALPLSVAIGLLCAVGPGLAQVAPINPEFVVRTDQALQRRALNARVFDQVIAAVDAEFYDPRFNGVDWYGLGQGLRPRAIEAADERELYQVLTELLEPLDDEHVNAEGPSVWALLARAQAPRVSAGLLMRTVDRQQRVTSVRIGSPADRAGVRPGWTLIAIDGAPFSYASLLSAEPGQAMQWEMIDEYGGLHDLSLVLEPPVAPRPPRRLDQPATGVFRLAWDGFREGDALWIDENLRRLPEGASVVLDLRGNGGGSVRELRTILGCFLAPGTPVFTRTTRAGVPEIMDALPGCRAFAGKVISLVDRESLSAAEMLAATLAEADRARIVGQRTGGAVLVSRSTELADGGRLSVSHWDFHTIGGVRLEKVGLEPSIEALTTFDDMKAGHDPALDAAVAALQAP